MVGFALLTPVMALISMNVFINTGLQALVNMQSERVRITWGRAFSFRPGEVEVWNLKIRLQDANAQWIVLADHATGVIDLRALADYRFSAHTIRVDEASFFLRMRRETKSVETLATPPIDGLENPPVRSPEILYGPPARFFHVQLQDLAVEHVRELWLEDYHFVGDARVSGGVDLLAHSWLEIDDLGLDIASGDIRLGDVPIAGSVKGRVDVALSGMNPDEHPGTDILRFLTARAELVAEVQDLRFLAFYLRKAPFLSISGGTGPIAIELAVDEERLLDGSRLGVNAHGLVARFLSYAVTGDGNVRLEVAPVDGQSEGKLSVEFLDYAINKWGDDTPHVQGTGLRVTADTADLALAEPFETLDVTLDLPDSLIPDVGVYNAYLPSDLGFTLKNGTGRAHGTLQASTEDNVAHGDLYLDARSIRASMDDLSLSGNVALHAHLVEGNLDKGSYDISGSKLELRDIGVVGAKNERQGKDDSRGWWADVRLPRGKVEVGAPVFLDASLAVQFRDTVPFVTIFSQANPLPGWARGLLNIKGVSGEARILLGEDTLSLPAFVLRGGQYEVLMQLRRKQTLFYGNLLARYGKLSLGMQLFGAESKIHMFDALAWYEAQPAP